MFELLSISDGVLTHVGKTITITETVMPLDEINQPNTTYELIPTGLSSEQKNPQLVSYDIIWIIAGLAIASVAVYYLKRKLTKKVIPTVEIRGGLVDAK